MSGAEAKGGSVSQDVPLDERVRTDSEDMGAELDRLRELVAKAEELEELDPDECYAYFAASCILEHVLDGDSLRDLRLDPLLQPVWSEYGLSPQSSDQAFEYSLERFLETEEYANCFGNDSSDLYLVVKVHGERDDYAKLEEAISDEDLGGIKVVRIVGDERDLLGIEGYNTGLSYHLVSAENELEAFRKTTDKEGLVEYSGRLPMDSQTLAQIDQRVRDILTHPNPLNLYRNVKALEEISGVSTIVDSPI